VKCAFVSEWECKIETEEIPLEVCRACIEARKTAGIFVKRRRDVGDD